MIGSFCQVLLDNGENYLLEPFEFENLKFAKQLACGAEAPDGIITLIMMGGAGKLCTHLSSIHSFTFITPEFRKYDREFDEAMNEEYSEGKPDWL
jgi:hypothetical protein